MSMRSLPGPTGQSGHRQPWGSIELMARTAICISKASLSWDCPRTGKTRYGQGQIAESYAQKTETGATFRCLPEFACKTSQELQRTVKMACGYLILAQD